MKILSHIFLWITFISSGFIFSQETLPIYQDYLSDNVYLVHPASAGIGECAKIRVTARTQWLGIDNPPDLQTASFHTRIDEEAKAGVGLILFNDKNGFHSQKGIQGTYAYHLELENGVTFNQLSFGLSLSGVFSEVDQRSFVGDPSVNPLIESEFYVNADFGVGYHYSGFSGYFTVKNLFLSSKNKSESKYESLNLRNYVLGVGYFFGKKEKIQLEPSMMFQLKEGNSEKLLDLNIKAYKKYRQAQLWLALSYRQSFDDRSLEEASYVSPILGINANNFMVSYTYTLQLNNVKVADDGFHQISLGYNLLCRKRRLSACPNINGTLF